MIKYRVLSESDPSKIFDDEASARRYAKTLMQKKYQIVYIKVVQKDEVTP